MRPAAKPWLFVIVFLLSFFTIRTALLMHGLEGWTTRPPYWDQASHALDAIHFGLALHAMSLSQFLVQLNESALWPPVIPLLQAPYLAVFGENFANVRTWLAFCSVPAMLMLFAVGVQSHRRFGILVGAVAASLLAVAPGYLEFCMQEMYEIPGIMLSMLTVFFYLKFMNKQDPKDWRWTCLSGVLLFFAKFNYAILVMLPIVVCEFSASPDFRRQIWLAGSTLFRDIRWRSPFTLFVFVYCLFLFYVSRVGIRFDLMGRHILIERAMGNPSYLLLGILLIRNLLVNRPLLKHYGQAIWQADEPVRSLFRINVLPALVWLSYPTFFSTFFIFLFSEKTRKASFFSMETLRFYPGAVLNLFTPHPVIGGTVLLSLALLLGFWRKLPRVSRFIVGLTAFNFFMTLLHPNYQERLLLATMPMLLISFGLALAHGAEQVLRAEASRWNAIVPVAAAGLALLILSFFAPSREFLQKNFTFNTQAPAMIETFGAICDEAVHVERNTLIGFSAPMAPASIALECYRRHPKVRRSQMPTSMTRHGFHGETSAEAIIASQRIEQFFVIDTSQLGRDVGRLQESHLLPGLIKALPLDANYLEKLILDQGPGGFRILAYRLKSGQQAQIGEF